MNSLGISAMVLFNVYNDEGTSERGRFFKNVINCKEDNNKYRIYIIINCKEVKMF